MIELHWSLIVAAALIGFVVGGFIAAEAILSFHLGLNAGSAAMTRAVNRVVDEAFEDGRIQTKGT